MLVDWQAVCFIVVLCVKQGFIKIIRFFRYDFPLFDLNLWPRLIWFWYFFHLPNSTQHNNKTTHRLKHTTQHTTTQAAAFYFSNLFSNTQSFIWQLTKWQEGNHRMISYHMRKYCVLDWNWYVLIWLFIICIIVVVVCVLFDYRWVCCAIITTTRRKKRAR